MRGGIVLHPAFGAAKQGLLRAMDTDSPGQLIFVIGMSGAGKSEIRYATMPIFAGHPSTWGVGKIPVIAVRATPSDRSHFNRKEFSSRLYLEILEPDVGWLSQRGAVDDADQGHLRAEARLTDPFWRDIRGRSTEHDLLHHFEKTAMARGLRAIFVEEGASLTHTQARKDPVDHMVSLMCLAEEIKAILVLFGVPRMAALWRGNAEIRRRSRFVYVDRYRFQDKGDRASFERLVVSLARDFSFSKPGLLRRNLDLAYAASAGVFGELKAYLIRADDLRAGDGKGAIQQSHLEEAIYPEGELETLHQEAAAFDDLRRPAGRAAIRTVLAYAR